MFSYSVKVETTHTKKVNQILYKFFLRTLGFVTLPSDLSHTVKLTFLQVPNFSFF